MEDHLSNSSTMSYDLLGRKTAMDDPDKGAWTYTYNGFGDLVCQKDAKGQIQKQAYDFKGRLMERWDYGAGGTCTTPTGTLQAHTEWAFDTAAYGFGQPDLVSDSISGYAKLVEYDSLGRPSKTVTSMKGHDDVVEEHYEKVTYDHFGRSYQTFDAARDEVSGDGDWSDHATQTLYNAYGYLDQITDAYYESGAPRTVYYDVQTMDVRGTVTHAVYGNGVNRYQTSNAKSGLVESMLATKSGSLNPLQELELRWDQLGNVVYRHEEGRGALSNGSTRDLKESFSYDNLNRLTAYSVNGGTATTLSYNGIGNITSKSDVASGGTYTYGTKPSFCNVGGMVTPGPHAVSQIGSSEYYCYDANGNLVKDSTGREFVYSSYDLVTQVTLGSKTTTFDYGPGRERIRRFDSDSGNSTTVTTLYLGGVEKIIKDNGSTLTEQWKRNIGGFLQITLDPNNSANDDSHYFIKDHLGSISLITDENGAVVQAMDFDPWGQRRDTSDWDGTITLTPFYKAALPITSKGFTGHETVDEMNIIHMNGRIYDARIARFLQADPIIQDPKNTQSLNRYSYGWNNPLNGIDPSGFGWLSDALKIVAAVVISVITYGAASGWAAAWVGAMGLTGTTAAVAAGAIAGAIAGFASGFVMTGSLHGAWQGALSGAVFGGVAGYFGGMNVGGPGDGIVRAGKNLYLNTADFAKLVVAQGTAGGVMSELQGGKFAHGFMSAGLTKAATPGILALDNVAMESAASAIVGGTVSELTGGKFANGAFSGGLMYAVNACSSGDCWKEFKSAFNYKLAFSPGLSAKAKIPNVEVSTGFAIGEGTEGNLAGENNDFIEGELTLLKIKVGQHAIGLSAEAHADLEFQGNSIFEYELVPVYTNDVISASPWTVGLSINPLFFKVSLSIDFEKIYDSVEGAYFD